MPGTPFDYLHHLVTVPVVADGHDARFILDSGIGLTLATDRDPRLTVVDGRDETSHARTRRFGAAHGRIHPAGAPEIAQDDPDVMFQAIRYDGLVGNAFLSRFSVTFDIPARRAVFA